MGIKASKPMKSYSAENRNQTTIPLHIQNGICCSLCRQPGHDITMCNSEILLEFETRCDDKL